MRRGAAGRALIAGAEAYAAGLARADNPYSGADPALARIWARGWDSAQRTRRGVLPPTARGATSCAYSHPAD